MATIQELLAPQASCVKRETSLFTSPAISKNTTPVDALSVSIQPPASPVHARACCPRTHEAALGYWIAPEERSFSDSLVP